jgi:hypothetical protein
MKPEEENANSGRMVFWKIVTIGTIDHPIIRASPAITV